MVTKPPAQVAEVDAQALQTVGLNLEISPVERAVAVVVVDLAGAVPGALVG
jgi:hypothetical protein